MSKSASHHQSSLSASAVETVIPKIQLSPPPGTRPEIVEDLYDSDQDIFNRDFGRHNSFDGVDSDTGLGPDLCRVATTPANSNGKPRTGGAIKLARMGISPSQGPGPRGNQVGRFGGLKSFVQSMKGRP